ncbi:MAG: Arc family DNA-binding protein, partial [Chloroflexi bacterium]|nr:Arc family DNA-binding protein [Chloroflexota bacterium]
MPDVALRGNPEQLHQDLKAAAKRSHRSLNGEILARLTASV